MDERKLDQISKDLSAVKRLLVLLLQHQQVKRDNIANALRVTGGRVSQLSSTRKHKPKKAGGHG